MGPSSRFIAVGLLNLSAMGLKLDCSCVRSMSREIYVGGSTM